MTLGKWPKTPPSLTAEQARQRHDFLKTWHEVLPSKYSVIEKFNHECPIILKTGVRPGIRTLEIGAGLGEHISREDLEIQHYTALEIREDFAQIIKEKFPKISVLNEDIEKQTSLAPQSFDRIIAIHILEHLRQLPLALTEIKRILKKDGFFNVVIPCEGGLAYRLARRVSAQRIFESHFHSPYKPIIENEHVNQASELIEELRKHFRIIQRSYWPLKLPLININLAIALVCRNVQPIKIKN
jgi:ubiquinone/menaquinone biosynthesis C-methylase UbiE